jgi:hypothetical protein
MDVRCIRHKSTKSDLRALGHAEPEGVVVHPRWIPRPFGRVKRVLQHGNNSFAVVHNFWRPNVPVAALEMVYAAAESEVPFE